MVQSSQEWGLPLDPGETFTSVAYFIPDIPNAVDSLIFTAAPEWTDFYPFDETAQGWDTALSPDSKTAYLYGPQITNDTSVDIQLFSFRLYYEWNDADSGFEPNYPVYQDTALYNNSSQPYDSFGRRGTPGDVNDPGTWEYYDQTNKEIHNPGSDEYENPVPLPGAIYMLGFGAAILLKKKSK